MRLSTRPFFSALLLVFVFGGSLFGQQAFNLGVRALGATVSSNPTFFVGTNSGLFVGDGGFAQLAPVYTTPAGTSQPSAVQIFVLGSSIYVRSDQPRNSVWTSLDGGATWTERVAGLPADFELSEIQLASDGKLFAVLRDGPEVRLYSSTDQAATWTFQADFPVNTDEVGINFGTPDLLFATAGRVFWRSTNGGQDWATVSTLPFAVNQSNGAVFIAPEPGNPMGVVLGGGGGSFGGGLQNGVYHSNDQGGTWELVITTVANRLAYGPSWPYYFHSDSTALGSIDVSLSGGRTWQTGIRFSEDRGNVMGAALPDPRNGQIAYIGSGSGAAGSRSSFFRSANSGLEWAPIESSVMPTIGGPEQPLVIELPIGAPPRTSRLDIRSVESASWQADYLVEDPGVSWLTLGAASGTTGEDGIPVIVDPSGLAEGEYTANVIVRSEQSNNKEISLGVTLRVTAALSGAQPIISTVAGTGDFGDAEHGGQASQQPLPSTEDVALGPDGSLYLAAWIDDVIDRIAPDGVYARFAGTGEEGFSGDGGPALQAQMERPEALAVGPDGAVFFIDDGNRRIRKIDPQGVITTVAGNGDFSSPRPETAGGDATAVAMRGNLIAVDSGGVAHVKRSGDLYRVTPARAYTRIATNLRGGLGNDMQIGSDGSVYLALDTQVVRVRPGGATTVIAGGEAEGYTGDGGPATDATLADPGGIALGDDGEIFVADTDNHAIRMIDSGGIIRTIAGGGAAGFAGDGGPALFASLSRPGALSYRDGRLYIHDDGNRRIRVIDFPSGAGPVLSSAGVVNAGSFLLNSIAPGENISIFGSNLALETLIATSTPLPSDLGGTRAAITDSGGATRPCVLFFVTLTQINCNVSDDTALGQASLTITTPNGTGSASIQVVSTAPGLFAANATGEGVSASIAIRIAPDGTQSVVDVIDTAQQPFGAMPIDLGPEGEQVVLLLYGTGIRNWQSIEVTIGGQAAEVIGVAPQGEFVGLDQVNVIIPRSLIGAGLVEVRMTVDGQAANVVTIRID